MSLFSRFKKKPENTVEQKLRDLREKEIQNYEANLPRKDEKKVDKQNRDA